MAETGRIQIEVDVSVMTLTTEVRGLRRHCRRHGCDCCNEVELHLDAIQAEIDKLSRHEHRCCSAIDTRLDRMELQLSEILRRLPDTTPAHIRLTAS